MAVNIIIDIVFTAVFIYCKRYSFKAVNITRDIVFTAIFMQGI
jgi:hypothetical protein